MRYRVFRTPGADAPRVLGVDRARFERGGALLDYDVDYDYDVAETMRVARTGTARTTRPRREPGSPARGR